MVAHHGTSLSAALRSIATGHVLAPGEGASISLRAGKDVVHVEAVATTLDHLALLGESRLFREVVGAVQSVNVLGDDLALGVLPGTSPDAVPRVDGTLTLGTEIRPPLLVPSSRRGRKGLAMPVRAFEAAEIRTLA